MAAARFIAGGGATPTEGTTDDEGRLTLSVPAHVAEVALEFPDQGMTHQVMIGHLDPIDEPSGVAARLEHLGYLPRLGAADVSPSGSASQNEQLAQAIAIFQYTQGIKPTGIVDDETRSALQKAHGS
ncbi:Hypothetical protein A7982_10731 [Minicystis rosea]|nr:Hypothetical protein A7982_10731 [Minicystis rosea]